MLIDSHAHLNFEAYQDDLLEVIGRCLQEKMKVINVGAAYDTSLKAVNLALAEPSFFSSLGLHPIHVYDEEFESDNFQDLINSGKDRVVAIGETGFDYFHLWQAMEKHGKSVEEAKAKQEKVFRAHIKLAKANDLALIIHGRNGKEDKAAYTDIYNVLKDEGVNRGVVHCYGGNLEEAKQFVELGFHLGFTGIVTFDKTGVLEEIIKWIPVDKMLIETDAPYLTPVPNRGKRNEPSYVKYVAAKVAEIKNMSTEEIIEITGKNAIKLFNLE
ncbi:MAG: TatD family hydrolase [Candidatus Komeilibacteria bacterium]|jgi:TatD DNase family protein|nr:TatD family hydrolase [Candidatus Komeilibacteria bacterium]MBT4447280.1 TatD family hydrolase [Candidatus Komeilibacteria bacterium]